MKALLIIDMQVGSFTPRQIRFDTDGLVKRINSLSARFRENGFPVYFIQHDGTQQEEFIPGTPEWELLPELEISNEDQLIAKSVNDCFYRSNLAAKLKEKNVVELYMTGCATDFCVDTTIRSALTKNFQVTVVEDGHTTADRYQLTAAMVIAHHNWIWENMTPVNGPVRVLQAAEILVVLK